MKVLNVRFMNAVTVGSKTYRSLVAGTSGHQEYTIEMEWDPKLPQFLAVRGHDPLRPADKDVRWLNMDNVIDVQFAEDPLAKTTTIKRRNRTNG